MGMYDTLILACPKCAGKMEWQSKAGVCGLKEYYMTDVPPAIAGDLHGAFAHCPHCGVPVRLVAKVDISPYKDFIQGDEDGQ